MWDNASINNWASKGIHTRIKSECFILFFIDIFRQMCYDYESLLITLFGGVLMLKRNWH